MFDFSKKKPKYGNIAGAKANEGAAGTSKQAKKPSLEVLPVRVHDFDKLVKDKGIERGSTVLISGGAGTGKTTFVMQSLYFGALAGERCIFISFEEEPEKIKAHMLKNFGWDFYELEKKGQVAIIKLDPIKVARAVEEQVAEKAGILRIQFRRLDLPFVPDKLGLDSLSALSIAFETEENYRKYIRQLFESLEEYDSVNYAITETEQNPTIYSRTGVEEFLADTVIVLYNMKIDGERENALEILKMRSSGHEKRMVPYVITKNGIEIFITKKI